VEAADVCETELADDVVEVTMLGGGPYPPQVELDDSEEEDELCVTGGG